MRFQLGELVTTRLNGIGIVIGVNKANAKSLAASKHSRELVATSSDIYYVLLPDHNHQIPFYASELTSLTNEISIS